MACTVKPFADDGQFVPVPHLLFDEVMPILSASAWKVLSFIVRKTIGWQKSSDVICYRQIVDGTGIRSPNAISEALQELQGFRPVRDGRKLLGWSRDWNLPVLIVSIPGERKADGKLEPTAFALNKLLEIEASEPSMKIIAFYELHRDNKHSLISNSEPTLLTVEDIDNPDFEIFSEIENLGDSAMTSILTLDALEHFDPAPRISGDWARYLCPLCGADKPRDDAHRSFCRKLPGLGFKCQRCSIQGRLGADADYRPVEVKPSKPKADWREVWQKASPQPLLETAGDRYLQRRGIDSKMAAQSGVVFSGRLYGRAAVCFPIRDANDVMVAVQGRHIDNSNPKCHGAGPVGHGVFATVGAFESEKLAVVEAPIDALSFAQMYEIPAIALCGCPPLPAWVLKRFKGELLLASDNDKAGEDAAATWARQAGRSILTRRIRPNAKDWNADLVG